MLPPDCIPGASYTMMYRTEVADGRVRLRAAPCSWVILYQSSSARLALHESASIARGVSTADGVRSRALIGPSSGVAPVSPASSPVHRSGPATQVPAPLQ